jgi:spore maturation protein CgeB
MICNRLVITDRLHSDTGVDLLFKENDDIVYFDTMDECVEKINFFIKNSDERNRIASNGYKKVLANHTITSRVTKLLSILAS